MKIAFYNRPDNGIVGGGDVVQMKKTAEKLEEIYSVEIIDFSGKTPGELIEWNPDIVHVFGVYPSTYNFLRAIKGHPNCPKIVLSTIYLSLSQLFWAQNMINDIFIRNNLWALDRLKSRTGYVSCAPNNGIPYTEVLSMVDGWLPNGVAELYDIRKDFNVPVKPFAIIPNSVSDEFFQDEEMSTELEEEIDSIPKPFIVTVGRIESRKNQAMLLQALRETDIPILFIGQSFDKQYLDMCSRIRKFLLVDQLSHSDLKGIYQKDCIYVLPSWLESPSLASMEALTAGCPIVVGNQGSEYEYFNNYATYIDPANHNDIKEKVFQTIDNRHLIRQKNKPFNYIAKKLYTWTETARATMVFYQEMIE
jgi:glycosyltransferase involved in cell wall biosynthesis